MLKNETVQYLNNTARMVSAYSSAAAGDVIALEAYEKNNYIGEFAERYQVPAELMRLRPSEKSLQDYLRLWLCGEGKGRFKDRRISKTFYWLLRRYLGEPRKVAELGEDRTVLDKLSNTEGEGPHYLVKDILFVTFKEGVLCFLLGHSEK